MPNGVRNTRSVTMNDPNPINTQSRSSQLGRRARQATPPAQPRPVSRNRNLQVPRVPNILSNLSPFRRTKSTRSTRGIKGYKDTPSQGKKRKTKVKKDKKSKRGSQKKRSRRASRRQWGSGEIDQTTKNRLLRIKEMAMDDLSCKLDCEKVTDFVAVLNSLYVQQIKDEKGRKDIFSYNVSTIKKFLSDHNLNKEKDYLTDLKTLFDDALIKRGGFKKKDTYTDDGLTEVLSSAVYNLTRIDNKDGYSYRRSLAGEAVEVFFNHIIDNANFYDLYYY